MNESRRMVGQSNHNRFRRRQGRQPRNENEDPSYSMKSLAMIYKDNLVRANNENEPIESTSSKRRKILSKDPSTNSRSTYGKRSGKHALQDKSNNYQSDSQTSQSSKASSNFVKTTVVKKVIKKDPAKNEAIESPFTRSLNRTLVSSSSEISGPTAKTDTDKLPLKDVTDIVKLSHSQKVAFRACDSALSQFKLLEKEGLLCQPVLQVFSLLPAPFCVNNMNFSPTYAPTLNDIGIHRPPSFPSDTCTRIFAKSFHYLQYLDLSHVPIIDDAIRYLTPLRSLQVLNLQGTSITDKSIRHLAKHASFRTTLKFLVLAHARNIGDPSMRYMNAFSALCHFDVFDTACTIHGLRYLAMQGNTKDFRFLRLPEHINKFLSTQHANYVAASRKYHISQDADEVQGMSVIDVKHQLKQHKVLYPSANIFLNLAEEELRKKLLELIHWRRMEEILWTISAC